MVVVKKVPKEYMRLKARKTHIHGISNHIGNHIRRGKRMEVTIDKSIDKAVDEAFEKFKNEPSLIMRKDGHLVLRKRRDGKSMMDNYLEEKYYGSIK